MSAAGSPATWHSVEGARPLVAWRAAQLAAAASVLAPAAQAWREAWGLPAGPGGVTCTHPTPQVLRHPWQCIAGGTAGAAWLSLPASFDTELAQLLWGCEDIAGPIALAVLAACRADLAARLRAALDLDAGGERVPSSCAWSGQVVAAIGSGVFLLLDAPAMVRLLRAVAPELAGEKPATALPALAPLTRAVGGTRLPLQARLADCELDLASLQDLRIGDIVPVPHRLDTPLRVCDAQGQAVLAGYLARRGQRKALDLASAEACAAPSSGKVAS